MRRGLVRTVKVYGLTLALSVGLAVALSAPLAAVAPSAHATWTARLDVLRGGKAARNNSGAVVLDRGRRPRQLADDQGRRIANAGQIFHTTALGSNHTSVPPS